MVVFGSSESLDHVTQLLILTLLNPINIIHIVSPSEDVEDCGTTDTLVLSQVQIVPDAPDDLCLTQYITVMDVILQAVNVSHNFHNEPSPMYNEIWRSGWPRRCVSSR